MTERREIEQQLTDEQLDRLLDGLEIEKAPPGLSRRLMAIPDTQPAPASQPGRERKRGWLPGWLLAPVFAAAPLALFLALMMQPQTPSEVEVRQAQQDLAVAFEYIQGVGDYTGVQIHDILGAGLQRSVKEPLSRHMPYTEQSQQETTS
jgi:hypothetical protein